MLRAILFLAFVENVVGDRMVRITNENDFKSFTEDVNKGSTFKGTTVYIDSDLSLSNELLEPIGNNSTYHFLGTFDGQGHIISNLKMNSSSDCTGLFGYSEGLTIKNVVLDSSCSIISSYSGTSAIYIGGIIGYCYASDEQCNIENSVNMADVTFSGNISNKYLYLGGVAGHLFSSLDYNYESYVKNFANYGSVTHSGTSLNSFIGGVVGYLSGSTYKFLQNCLNYGAITHNGTTSSELNIGGIVGYSYYAYIEDCVSAGKISTQKTQSTSYVKSIVGLVSSYAHINCCYSTGDAEAMGAYSGTPTSLTYILKYNGTSFELNGNVSVGSFTGNSLIDALNAAADYHVLRGYSRWLLNKENKSAYFIVDGRTSPIAMDYQIILLPSLASEGGLWFDGWYNDSESKNHLESYEIYEDREFYGKFEESINEYIITFDTRREGSSVAPIAAQFCADVSLPSELIREHCSIAWWETEYGYNVGFDFTMPAHNMTLYAVWKCTHITTLEDLIDFSKVVSSRIDCFSGTTVYLDSDLSLSKTSLEPINYFRGTFDGQGHIISDIKMNSSALTGLFGYSEGLTIRNVVLDSSCSITSSYSGSTHEFMGGIIGYCKATKGDCNIENSVNMADVTFEGDVRDYHELYLGGIVGYLYSSSKYPTYVKNCANYGPVTHSGTSYDSFIGGLAGFLYASGPCYNYIHNCLNYGAITHNGTTSSVLEIGGIVGRSNLTYVENCVSAGKLSKTKSTSYIGNIAGYIYFSEINYCYFTSDVGINKMYGGGTPKSTEIPSNIVYNLNGYASNKSWSKWLFNKNGAPVSFIVNYGKELTLSSQIILLPNLVDDSYLGRFGGWYKNPFCNELFQESSVTETMSLYGLYGEIIGVTFDTNGGSVSGKLKNVIYNSPYGELPEAHRTGHMFAGWFTEKANGTKVTNETIVADPEDHVLYAHWGLSFTFVVIIAVPVVVVVVVVVIIVLFVVLRKKDFNDRYKRASDIKSVKLDDCPRDEYSRIITTTIDETEAKVALGNSRGILTNLYPQGYERPSMRDALFAASLTEEQTDLICEACEIASQKASKDGYLTEKFTEADAAAVAMYTYDFGPSDFEHNPYRIINKSLVGRNYKDLQKARGLLYLVMNALRKLPRYTGRTLYRGVRGGVNLNKDHYHKGNTITWPALSSTSPSMETTKTFLARGSESRNAVGTLFIIEGGWGYNIQPYSLFPDEVEILLEPERQFEVTGVIEAELTIINLQMLDTPLPIPEVFGGK